MLAEVDQRADGIDGQAEVARMADEGEAIALLAGIAPLVALRALGRGDEAHLLVVADGRNLDARGPGKIADRQHRLCLIENIHATDVPGAAANQVFLVVRSGKRLLTICCLPRERRAAKIAGPGLDA